MFTYQQSTGLLLLGGVVCVQGCYAGRDGVDILGKNNPEEQQEHGIGPLPQGRYTVSPLHTVPHLGPCMALTPAPTNMMFDRYGFFIHLDNPAHKGESSDGRIALPNYTALAAIAAQVAQGEDQLTVIA